jgi:hypothetical protein
LEKLLGSGTFCNPLAPATAIGKAFSLMIAALFIIWNENAVSFWFVVD